TSGTAVIAPPIFNSVRRVTFLFLMPAIFASPWFGFSSYLLADFLCLVATEIVVSESVQLCLKHQR
ncbi:MAG: hypothetical protein WBE32_16660, partial [Pseudolabrys sp.]